MVFTINKEFSVMDSRCSPPPRSWFSWLCSLIQSPLLLVIRVIWGLLFIQAGWGKLNNMASTIEFFTQLDIMYPEIAAWAVALFEAIGGGLLLIGLWTRLASVPLIVIMVTALLTAHQEATLNLHNNFGEFMDQSPFTFLFATLVLCAFGPGSFSLDWILGCSKGKKPKQQQGEKNE